MTVPRPEIWEDTSPSPPVDTPLYYHIHSVENSFSFDNKLRVHLVPFARYGDLLVKSHKFFSSHLYLALLLAMISLKFRKHLASEN